MAAGAAEVRGLEFVPEETPARSGHINAHEPHGYGPVWPGVLGRLAVSLLVAIFLGFLALPIGALLFRVPLDDLLGYVTSPLVLNALGLSLATSLISLGLMVLFGTPVAYLLGRYRFRARRALETLVEIPVVMPPAAAGVALLLAFGRRGLLGPSLDLAGLDIAFSTAAVVLAQCFVASPFYVTAAAAAFRAVPPELSEVASTDGAGWWARFRHVVLPLAIPGIAGGAAMAWARALGEFGATILFAGNFQGRTQTMPLAIYTALESDLNAAIVLSAILVVFSFALLITFKLLTNRQVERET